MRPTGLAAAASLICERLEILRDGREDELVAGAGEASQSHALEAVLDLQVSNAHLYFLALIARLLKLRSAL